MSAFTGTGKLLKLYLRRDRFLLPMWALLAVMTVMGQISFITAMDDWSELLAELSGSALTAALLGPIIPLSLEGAVLWRGFLQCAMVVMLGAALTAVRHCRTEEQSGRAELLYSRTVGRFAPILAITILNGIACIAVGVLVAIAFIFGGFGATGAMLAGLVLALCGWACSGAGLVLSQIFSNYAKGAVIAAFFITYVPMMINNVYGGQTGWAWFAPQSWVRLVEPYGENRVWPILILKLSGLLLPLLAAILMGKRDFGGGLAAQREGRGEAAPSLCSPLTFALRQVRGMVLAICAGAAFIGFALGSIAPSITGTMGELMTNVFEWGVMLSQIETEVAFIGLFIFLMVLMPGVSIFVITTVQTMRKDELRQYAELVLSRPVGRIRWMAAYLSAAGIGCAVILLVIGISTGMAWAVVSGDMGRFTEAMVMCFSKWPVLLFFIGITAALYGWMPRISAALSWAILGLFIVVEMLWEVGYIPWQILRFMTPFAWAHYATPLGSLSMPGLLVLAVFGAALCALGCAGFKQRSVGV